MHSTFPALGGQIYAMAGMETQLHLLADRAGYMYWFPKAFGFRLHDGWGKIAFWNWPVGFLLAFMPLYMLGFMGMPRRMEHYANPAWQPYLIVAAVGMVIIALGVFSLIVQLIVSLRHRRENLDLSGDSWNGRTLEWASVVAALGMLAAVIVRAWRDDQDYTLRLVSNHVLFG